MEKREGEREECTNVACTIIIRLKLWLRYLKLNRDLLR